MSDLMTPDEVRRALIAIGVPPLMAQRAADSACLAAERPRASAPTCGSSRIATRTQPRSEAQVQIEIIRALRDAGWYVWRVGQRNAKGTQDAGVPDLIAMRAGAETGECGWLAFVECKRERGGRQSPAQQAFEDAVSFVVGGTHGEPRVTYTLASGLEDVRNLLSADGGSECIT